MEASSADRIAALEAELAAVRAEMQQFTYTVSHDLRAPLRHITSFAQLVQEDAGPLLTSEVQGFLATMTDSARHMGVLLDGLLEISRIGSMPIHLTAVDPLPLIRDICAELTSKYPLRGLEWHLPGELPAVQADAGLLRLVLSHILGNAAKFTANRSVGVVEVTGHQAAENAGALELEVADNGVGFNPALQDGLFKVFGRLHSAREFEGVGIGLVLSRKALLRLHGAVTISAVHNSSCQVRILLPLAPGG